MKTDCFHRFRGGATAALVILVCLLAVMPAAAQTGAVGNGDWSSAATWTNGVPVGNGAAFIGTTAPTGAATSAIVTLSQDSSARSLYLGYGTSTSGTLGLNNFTLTAGAIYLGDGGAGTILRTGGGRLMIHGQSPNVAQMFVKNSTFSFAAGDVADSLDLSNHSTATTTATGNLVYAAAVYQGSTLNLGADVALAPPPIPQTITNLAIQGTLNANGHAISTPRIAFGYGTGTSGPGTFENDGLVITGEWGELSASQIRLNHPGDAFGALALSGNSSLTMADAAGQLSGLTLTGQLFEVESGSHLLLEVNGLANGWVFRRANPVGSNHIATLQSLIGQGVIDIVPINGGSYGLSADSAYTYVNVVPVPEPSAFVLSLAAVGLFARRRFKK